MSDIQKIIVPDVGGDEVEVIELCVAVGDTIDADDLNGDEEWTCTVTPNDGTDDGSSASATATVEGSCFEGWDDTEVDLGDTDYLLTGASESDEAGYSVASAGDVDGDGLDDLLIGAPEEDSGGDKAGAAYRVMGASLLGTATIDLSEADYMFIGEQSEDKAGFTVAGAGDVDGDGLDDILIGAHFDDDGGSQAGKENKNRGLHPGCWLHSAKMGKPGKYSQNTIWLLSGGP